MYTFILQHSVCGAFAITILAIYAVRIAREWREYHPKQVTENTAPSTVETRHPCPPSIAGRHSLRPRFVAGRL